VRAVSRLEKLKRRRRIQEIAAGVLFVACWLSLSLGNIAFAFIGVLAWPLGCWWSETHEAIEREQECER
jgi:hypothetical protein